MISLTPEHLDEVAKRIAALPNAASKAQAETVRKLGDAYLDALKAETPVKTGALRDAYQVAQNYTNLEAEYRITNETTYLRWVVKGRPAVVATTANALRFTIGGTVLFRKRVGPAAPNPFPDRAARAMEGKIAAAKASLPTLIVRNYGL